MLKKLLFFLLMPFPVLCQTSTDYSIYSKIINEKVLDWKKKDSNISQVVITDRLSKHSLDSSFIQIVDELNKENLSTVFTFLKFYDNPIEIWNNEEFILLKNKFKSEVFKETDLKAEGFKIDVPVKIVSKQWIEKLFNTKRNKGFEKAWKKFYNEYPLSPGYFEFSKISYSKNFAVVYVVWRAKPMIGNGRLEILKMEKEKWTKLAYFNMWNN
jgi:hypothetical protein